MSAFRSGALLRSAAAAAARPASRSLTPALSRSLYASAVVGKDNGKGAARSSEPIKMPAEAPQFPAPTDPFAPEPLPKQKQPQEYSESTKNIVRGVAKLMGYNSRASTAIRETGRMMHGIVGAVEKERVWWYDTCALPPTYQTFFQLHLLYVLILAVRLRALRASRPDASPVPEPLEPGSPSGPADHTHPSAKGGFTIGRPAHETYPTELLSHFFELAESQMRLVLGRGERERVIRKYMEEMGEQWKGAGTGLDYVLGLGLSTDPAESRNADAELASWAWRNLFASRGIAPGPGDELAFIGQLDKVVRFVRRELARLDGISDADVLDGNIGEWGRVDQ